MSVWKSNFFLQTGLPESLPKPPERPVAEDEEFAKENDLPTTRRVGHRGKDKSGRKKRAPSLFNFFQCMRSLESREADGNVIVRPEELRVEYLALSRQQRAFWEYMHELFMVFEQQQKVADWGKLTTESAHSRKRKLWHKFYFLEEPQQQQLVRDYVAHRWEKENYQYVRETCHQDNLRHLVDIRRDLRLLLDKVDRALAPREDERGASCADD
jgi:hypothetical protein